MKNKLLFFTFTLLQIACTDSAPTKTGTKQVASSDTKQTTNVINNIISPTSNAQFTFNQGITNYQFERVRNKIYNFVDTEQPTEIVEAFNTMVFQEMEDMNLDKRTDMFWFWIDSMAQVKQREFENNDLQQTKIGAYDALVFDSEYVKAGKKGAIYMVLLSKGDRVIKFVGTAYGNVEKAKHQFKHTAASIKFK